MGLSRDELNAVTALWQEWTADCGFSLTVEVREHPQPAEMTGEPLGARLTTERYLQVQIRRGDRLVFDEPCPYDAVALRASISVLSRVVARAVEEGSLLPFGAG